MYRVEARRDEKGMIKYWLVNTEGVFGVMFRDSSEAVTECERLNAKYPGLTGIGVDMAANGKEPQAAMYTLWASPGEVAELLASLRKSQDLAAEETIARCAAERELARLQAAPAGTYCGGTAEYWCGLYRNGADKVSKITNIFRDYVAAMRESDKLLEQLYRSVPM